MPHSGGFPVAGVTQDASNEDAVRTLAVDDDGHLLVTTTPAAPGSTTDTKAEDAAHSSGDVGSFILGVRNDADAARTGTDGDYSPISVDSAGRLRLRSDKDEDAAHASADVGTFILGVRNDTNTTRTGTDGDYSPISVDSTGRIRIRIEQAEDAGHTSGDSGVMVLGVRNDTLSGLTGAPTATTSADAAYGQVSTDSSGRQLVRLPVDWTVSSSPAADAQATASRAAGAAGVRHVCTAVSARLAVATALGAQTTFTVNLRDGATGAGAVLMAWRFVAATTVALNYVAVELSGLNIIGTAATAMTLEFTAGAAGALQNCNISGYDII